MIIFRLHDLAIAKDPTSNPMRVHVATNISYPSILRLWNNNPHVDKIALETIDKLCDFLECEPGDLIKRVTQPPTSD